MRYYHNRGGGPNRPPKRLDRLAMVAAALAVLMVVGLMFLPRPLYRLIHRPARCDRFAGATPQTMPTRIVMADVSESMSKQERKFYCKVLNRHVDTRPRRVLTIIYAYDCDRPARKLYEGRPRDSRDLIPIEQSLINDQSAPRKGSYLAVALQTIVMEVRQRAQQPIYGLILSDGEDSDRDRTRAVARQLSAFGNVKAVFVGPVEKDGLFRTAIEHDLAALGDRYITASALDVGQRLEDFRARIHYTAQK